jgi:flagellar FliL protein
MSAAATAEVAPPVKGGKKKLLLFGVVGLVVALVVVVAAVLLMKSRAQHAAEEGSDEEAAAAAPKKSGHEAAPTFLPLDVFVVNLADKDADRYAQVGIVLELDSPMVADQVKAYMPAVRNAILMILAHKNSRELLERAGKEQLADEIMRETVRPLGIDIPPPRKVKPAKAEGQDDEADGEPQERPRRRTPHNPVRHVHFSNFIIQ